MIIIYSGTFLASRIIFLDLRQRIYGSYLTHNPIQAVAICIELIRRLNEFSVSNYESTIFLKKLNFVYYDFLDVLHIVTLNTYQT